MPRLQINTLGNHHFCIKDSTTESILNILDASFSETFLFDSAFSWDFLYGPGIEESKKRFLLFDKIGDWNYLRGNAWDFEETRKQTLLLSEKLNTKVYYFFIDPWIFTLRWVLAEKGTLIKAYFESHNEILNNEGYFEIEEQIKIELQRENNTFWEDKFWKLYQRIYQPIEVINTKENILVVRGEIK